MHLVSQFFALDTRISSVAKNALAYPKSLLFFGTLIALVGSKPCFCFILSPQNPTLLQSTNGVFKICCYFSQMEPPRHTVSSKSVVTFHILLMGPVGYFSYNQRIDGTRGLLTVSSKML